MITREHLRYRTTSKFLSVLFINFYFLTVLTLMLGFQPAEVNAATQTGGLVAAYNFDEGAGTTLRDVSGAANDGTIAGESRYQQGKNNKALRFNGINNQVNIANNNSLDLTGGLTLETWVLPYASGTQPVIFKERSGGAAYALYAAKNNQLPAVEIFTGGRSVSISGPNPLRINKWAHLAATFDEASLRLFVNGVEVNSLAVKTKIDTSTGSLQLGGSSVTNSYFDGELDDLRIYNRALSSAELQADSSSAVQDKTAPIISVVNPKQGASETKVNTSITATFSKPMDAKTINDSTFELKAANGKSVPATITYNSETDTAVIVPKASLTPSTKYTAKFKSGSSGPKAKEQTANTLVSDYSWSFNTGAATAAAAPQAKALTTLAAVPPDDGPGGPILIISNSANPFTRYYTEILLAEGLNYYTASDLTNISASTLTGYDIVILGEMSLTNPQVTMLSDWVTAGGNLIAMRPDKKLAGLLGLTDAASVLSDAYLLLNTSSGPGVGLVSETIQYHGPADRYTLNGSASLATLYSNATTATANPAVTLRSVGSNGGQAAAFTYDLARSIVLTRQGNPAWAGQNVNGVDATDSSDMFIGAPRGMPDWNDLSKAYIPIADEQQRMLANLITQMDLAKKPLPRFWYFPRDKKAVIVMTGDDHGGASNGTNNRFTAYKATGPAGCSVIDWECVRATSYVYANVLLTNAQAAGFNTDGFEVGLHVNTNCADFTPASFAFFVSDQLADWKSKYTSIPYPQSNRTHCVTWSDWASEAKVELQNNIRLDTNYYYYPGSFAQNRPGYFNGTGMVMRFADLDGSKIDVYQATTQMTDESFQDYPFTINALLSKALGSEGYYSVLTANMHTDAADFSQANAVINTGLSNGVPVVSALQMLQWVDGRNNSSFGSLNWSGNTLSFTITVGSGARNLRSMLPLRNKTGANLTAITVNGNPVTFTNDTIKGITYAFFNATNGAYQATYTPDTIRPTVTANTPASGATNVVQTTSVTATFSEALDPATVSGSTFELRDSSNNLVTSSVAYNATTRVATLVPTATLVSSASYTATLKGGATDPRVKDIAGNALLANFAWSFTTTNAPPPPPPTIGYNTVGSQTDSYDYNYMNGSRFNTGASSGSISSISAYVGAVGAAPNNQFQVAIYNDNNGAPGTLLASSTSGNLAANSWNSRPVSASLSANTYYWLVYNTNGANGNLNNLQYDNGTSNQSGYAPRTFGTWANPFGNIAYSNIKFSIYATFGAAAPDTTPPTVTANTPASGATNVVQTTSVTATFSEALDPATVSGSTFELRDSSNNLVASSVSYNASTSVATLVPTAALATSTTYTATLKGGATDPRVKDAAGNALAANFAWSFTTVAPPPPDTTPPTVTANTPANAATGVATNTTVTATFSEDLDPTSVSASTFELRDSTNSLVTGSVSYNASTRVATLTPAAALTGSTSYTATVKGGTTDPRVKDAAGNALAANFAWSFTTVVLPPPDTTPPTVTANTPASGATNVVQTTSVTATFSEALDPTTVSGSTFELRDSTSNLIASTVSYNSSTRVATLTPTASLLAGGTYTATVKGGATDPRVKDAAGNALAANFAWSFTTVLPDTTPPTVTANTPAANATGIATNSTVTATFSEAVDSTTVSTSTFELRDASNSLVASTVSYNSSTRVATLTPTTSLGGGKVYTATVKGGATDPRVKDVAGNSLAANFSWSFTTTATAATFGYTTAGSQTDSHDYNYMNGSRFNTGANSGPINSISVHVGAVGAAPNNQFQVAIYADNNGVPGALIASSTSGNLVANAWNSRPVSATLTANTNYWLMYNANGSNSTLNNLHYDAGTTNQSGYKARTFGTWINPFGAITLVNVKFSMYATFGS